MLVDWIKNNMKYADKYHTHSEAVIVSCYFNPQNSPYRLKAFNIFYESIKHLNHSIIECVIGDSKPQLEESEHITRIHTENLLWHKETLLNKVISELPKKYKYVFWVDADVIFKNLNWLVDGVKELQVANIIQPFSYCVHLEKDEMKPAFNIPNLNTPNRYNKNVWRSFCANYVETNLSGSEIYNDHGHVGLAWGARRSVLEEIPLYDKALIGGADHIMAHAAAGQINHKCITKSFYDNIDEVNDWSMKFFKVVNGNIGFVHGDLYHIWHGDTSKRQYLKRIQDFTPETKKITERDSNGLFITKRGDSAYMKNYMREREVSPIDDSNDLLDAVVTGYVIESVIDSLGSCVESYPSFPDAVLSPVDGGDFGGGTSGGGGATSEWDSNNENFS